MLDTTSLAYAVGYASDDKLGKKTENEGGKVLESPSHLRALTCTVVRPWTILTTQAFMGPEDPLIAPARSCL